MLHVTQVLSFLTHADADVRDHAARYFLDLGDASPVETADELWKAIDQFGDLKTELGTKERQRFLHALQEVPMNEASITRAIQMLDTCGSDMDCLFAASRIFQKMPIEMLKQRQAEILPQLSGRYRISVKDRLSMETLDAEQIWTGLTEFGARADEGEKFDSNSAESMLDALARHPDVSIPLAMGVLEDPQDRWWLEIWCCELLGKLRHALAIDLLAQKIETEDANILRQSAAEALGRMPAEIVVPRMETAYVSDDPFHRMVVSDVLGHVKDPPAEAALLRLYPTEDSQTGMTGIAIALCELCTTDGLEQLRQIVIDDRYDTQIADIKELFVTVAKMTGYAPPELEEWKRQLKDPVYKKKLRSKFLSSFGMDEKMVDEFRNYLMGKPIEEPEEEPIAAMPRSLAAPSTIRRIEPKIGRNDPCPCGSGKKYKKCCGK